VSPKEPEISGDDFSGAAVRRGVLKDTLQHPLTILPAAISAVSLMYMGLISFDPRSFGVGFGAALFGAAAWVVNYFFRGESFAAARMRRLQAMRDAQKEMVAASLRAACEAERFPRGVDAAKDLAEVYAKLQRLLAMQAASGKASAVRFASLAEDTYREGLQLLRAALDIHRALREIDGDKLRRELSAWEKELRTVEQRGRAEAAAAAREALETRIAGHRRRLTSYDERHAALQRLLAQCEALESALETAYLEVLDLGHEKDQLLQGQAASRLERAVAAARIVEDRLRAAQDHSEADAVYLQHGGRART
jgi:hypothetical protein